jgi:hypothetical protein
LNARTGYRFVCISSDQLSGAAATAGSTFVTISRPVLHLQVDARTDLETTLLEPAAGDSEVRHLRLPGARLPRRPIESGTRVPNLATILRLSIALDCKPTALLAAFDKLNVTALLRK